jgi:hypothetical protein
MHSSLDEHLYEINYSVRACTYSKNVLDVDCQTQGRLKLVIALYSYGHGISSVILLSIRKNL